VTLVELSCSNTLPLSGSFTMAGMDLSHPGPLTLAVTLGGIDQSKIHNADGTCSIASARNDKTVALIGGWDGTQGAASASVLDNDGLPLTVAIEFTATR